MTVDTAPKKVRRDARPYSTARTVVAYVVGVVAVIPLLWVVINSLRSNGDIVASESPISWATFFPRTLTGVNYVHLLQDGFFLAMWNSTLVAAICVLVGLLLTSMAAYALAAIRFRGRQLIFTIIVIGFMVPFEATAIPLYDVFVKWGLLNTIVGLALPGIANGLAVFNLRQAFLGLPPSLREAAFIDGASEWRIYRSVYLPLNKAALTNSGILLFVGQWTSYLWPLLIVNVPSLELAPINLSGAFAEHTSDFGYSFAGTVVLSLIPAVVLIAMRRYFFDAGSSEGERG